MDESVGVAIDAEMYERLRAVSEASGIPIEKLIARALEVYLKERFPDKQPARDT